MSFIDELKNGYASVAAPQLYHAQQLDNFNKQRNLVSSMVAQQAPDLVAPLMEQALNPTHKAMLQTLQRAMQSPDPALQEEAYKMLYNNQDRTFSAINPTDLIKNFQAGGIDVADPQNRDLLLQAILKPQTQINMGKPAPPSGYNYKANSDELYAIPGGPHDPTSQPLTDAQGKATGYYMRADQSNKIISNLESSVNPVPGKIKDTLSTIPVIGDSLSSIASAQLTPEQQQLDAAERSFVTAILRQDSQGAITDEEFKMYKKEYFPQPGDSTIVREQKKKAREAALGGLKEVSGMNMRNKYQSYQYPADPALGSPAGTSQIPVTNIEMTPQQFNNDIKNTPAEKITNEMKKIGGKTFIKIGNDWHIME